MIRVVSGFWEIKLGSKEATKQDWLRLGDCVMNSWHLFGFWKRRCDDISSCSRIKGPVVSNTHIWYHKSTGKDLESKGNRQSLQIYYQVAAWLKVWYRPTDYFNIKTSLKKDTMFTALYSSVLFVIFILVIRSIIINISLAYSPEIFVSDK